MNIAELWQNASDIKERLQRAQQQAAELTATGEAGGGLVQVTASGRQQVVSVNIDPTLLTAQSRLQLEQWLQVASNAALSQAALAVREHVVKVSSEFGIDVSELAGLGGLGALSGLGGLASAVRKALGGSGAP